MTAMALILLGIILALKPLIWIGQWLPCWPGPASLGIALGFAGKDMFADFIAGIVLHFEHPFHLGDRIDPP